MNTNKKVISIRNSVDRHARKSGSILHLIVFSLFYFTMSVTLK